MIPRTSPLGDPTIPRAQLLRPYPKYTSVSLYRNNVGTSRFDALEIGLQRRFSQGLSFSASYTRSRLVDDASSVFDASVLTGPVANYPIADSLNLRRERDRSTGDIPHVLVSSAVWDLPAGDGRSHRPGGWLGWLANEWTVTAVATLQSGTPVPVTQATNFNAFAGFGVQRPNQIGDPRLPGERADAGALVRHERICDGAAVHPRIGFQESGSRPCLSRPGSRGHQARTPRRAVRPSSCARKSSTP